MKPIRTIITIIILSAVSSLLTAASYALELPESGSGSVVLITDCGERIRLSGNINCNDCNNLTIQAEENDSYIISDRTGNTLLVVSPETAGDEEKLKEMLSNLYKEPSSLLFLDDDFDSEIIRRYAGESIVNVYGTMSKKEKARADILGLDVREIRNPGVVKVENGNVNIPFSSDLGLSSLLFFLSQNKA